MTMKEFDPTCERHYPLFIVKAVEPGCTTEIQIENAQTGEITRLTTTEDSTADDTAYLAAVVAVAKEAWSAFAGRAVEVGTVATGGKA